VSTRPAATSSSPAGQGSPDEEVDSGLGISHGAWRSAERLHGAREVVRRSVRVAGTAGRSGDPGVDRGAGGGHAFSAERGTWARLAAGGRRSFQALCAAVAADSHRTERTRIPLAGGRERREAQVHAAARQRRAARDRARPQHVGERRGVGVRRAVARRHGGRVREVGWRGERRGDPRARRRHGTAASRSAPRHVARVTGLAAGRFRVFLCRISRARRGARGRRVAMARRLRAPARVGLAGPADLRRRPCEAVLVRG
jgi:hypothetical protein